MSKVKIFSSNPVLSFAFLVLVTPSIQLPKPESCHLGLCPQFSVSGTESNQFYLLIFFISASFSPLTATILVQNFPCNPSLCPLPCLPPAACHTADRAINCCHCLKLPGISPSLPLSHGQRGLAPASSTGSNSASTPYSHAEWLTDLGGWAQAELAVRTMNKDGFSVKR